MAELRELFKADPLDMSAIGEWLDSANDQDRLAAVRGLGKSEQKRLFATAPSHHPKLDLEYMVPSSLGSRAEVIHEGHNSLPVFTMFQKRYCRMDSSPDLAGYNEGVMRFATGPGYFVARKNTDDRGDIAIDYTSLPTEKADDWPEIVPQEVRLGRFVYSNMVDVLRYVSQHVTIGRAWIKGKETGNYFLLCRQDRS